MKTIFPKIARAAIATLWDFIIIVLGKPNNKGSILNLSTEQILECPHNQNRDPSDYLHLTSAGGLGDLNGFQVCIFPQTNPSLAKEVPEIPLSIFHISNQSPFFGQSIIAPMELNQVLKKVIPILQSRDIITYQ